VAKNYGKQLAYKQAIVLDRVEAVLIENGNLVSQDVREMEV